MDDDRTQILAAPRAAGTIRARLVSEGGPPSPARTFESTFRIGRHPDCELRVDVPMVSRLHAAVELTGAGWRLRDLGSANGTLVHGTRLQAPLDLSGTTRVRLGPKGPTLELEAEDRRPTPPPPPPEPPPSSPRRPPVDARSAEPGSVRRSLDEYARRYLGDDEDEPAGDHTRMVRQLITAARTGQRRRLRVVAAVGLIVAIALGSLAVHQLRLAHKRGAQLDRLRTIVDEIFLQGKTIDVQLAQLRSVIEETGRADLRTQVERLAAERAELAEAYEGYVNELGSYRRLSPRERLMHRVARVFNEAETVMPASFVAAVDDMLDGYWLTPTGRERFMDAFAQLHASGDLPFIVSTLAEHGLPPQLVYVALQESNFDPHAVGPPTRWGRAKGMWQIIPVTARRFGLDPGPAPDSPAANGADERLDVRRATVAAARYLQVLYGTFAQASGLLTIAAYNWGEHRILPRLEELDEDDGDGLEVFADLPEDPEHRTYWRFFVEHRDRIPDQTSDYVLKIFAAAVIGEDPRAFGLDIDDPLEAAPAAPAPATLDPWATS